jgi:hypothetical protein
MAFRPVTIPLGTGARGDLDRLALSESPLFTKLENVSFAVKGGLTNRPSITKYSDVATSIGAGAALTAALDQIALNKGSGMFAAPFPGKYGAQSPLVMYQGAAYVRRADLWQKVGEPLAMRVGKSVGLMSQRVFDGQRLGSVSCGPEIVGVVSAQGSAQSLPFIGANDEIKYSGTAALTAVDEPRWSCVANNSLFYTTFAGDVRAQISGTLPTTTDVLLAAGVARGVAADVTQRISAVYDIAQNIYFVAFVSSTAGRITILSLNGTTGAVVNTLNVNGLGTVLGCALAGDTATRLMLAWVDTAATQLKTKVFTVVAAAPTDAAIDLAFNGANLTANYFGFTIAPIASTVNAQVMYTSATGGCIMRGRSFAAATTATTTVTLFGRFFGVDDGYFWEPLFGAVQLGTGRYVAGFQYQAARPTANGKPLRHSAQWVVLDVTEQVLGAAAATTVRRVVAYSKSGQNERAAPHPAAVLANGDIAFGVFEGITFDDVQGVSAAAARRIRISPSSPASADAQGLMYFSTAGGHVFDGLQLKTHGFVETYPLIMGDSSVTGAGTMPAGAYTYQVTWETFNAAGQLIRSGASAPYTITGVPINSTVTIAVTVPQLLEYPAPQNSVRVRLWGTTATPSAGAPLYYISDTTISAIPASGDVQVFQTTPTDITQEQLYTGGGVFDDEPVPTADRGVTYALDRVWVADQENVYASKILRGGIAPAFSTDLLALSVPRSLGPIQGIGGNTEMLVVVCSNGVAQVRGAGYDDLGNGPGWVLESLQGPGAGLTTPRSVINTPQGVVFEATRTVANVSTVTGLHVVAGGQVEHLSSSAPLITTPGDISFVVATTDPSTVRETSPLIVHGTPTAPMRVFDVESGQWCHWVTTAIVGPGGSGSYHANVNGVLWVQDQRFVGAFDGVDTYDMGNVGTSWNINIATTHLRPASATGWGRLRKMVLVHRMPSYIIGGLGGSVTFAYDEIEQAYGPYTLNTNPGPSDNLWPRTTWIEVWPLVQRCTSVALTMNVSIPAGGVLHAIELWVSASSDIAPSSTRG